MDLPRTITLPANQMLIRRATTADLPAILGLFDQAVDWLVGKGITGQWGTSPFSALPNVNARFTGWIEPGNMFVGEIDGDVVGCVAVTPEVPKYVAEAAKDLPTPHFYIEAFATARTRKGQGIGRALLNWVDQYTREQHITYLHVDCYADNPGLVNYYVRAGYTPLRDFWVGKWRGMLFERLLAES